MNNIKRRDEEVNGLVVEAEAHLARLQWYRGELVTHGLLPEFALTLANWFLNALANEHLIWIVTLVTVCVLTFAVVFSVFIGPHIARWTPFNVTLYWLNAGFACVGLATVVHFSLFFMRILFILTLQGGFLTFLLACCSGAHATISGTMCLSMMAIIKAANFYGATSPHVDALQKPYRQDSKAN